MVEKTSKEYKTVEKKRKVKETKKKKVHRVKGESFFAVDPHQKKKKEEVEEEV